MNDRRPICIRGSAARSRVAARSPSSSSGCPAASPANARRSPHEPSTGIAGRRRRHRSGQRRSATPCTPPTTTSSRRSTTRRRRRGRRSRAQPAVADDRRRALPRRRLVDPHVHGVHRRVRRHASTPPGQRCADDARLLRHQLVGAPRHDAEVAVGEPTASTEEIAGPDRRCARRSPSTARPTPTACSTTACSPASTPATSWSR